MSTKFLALAGKLLYYGTILANKAVDQASEGTHVNSNYMLISAIADGAETLRFQCMVDGHSALRAVHVAIDALLRHTVVSEAVRAKNAKGKILPGTIVEARLKPGTTTDQMHALVVAFIKDTDQVEPESLRGLPFQRVAEIMGAPSRTSEDLYAH